MVVDKEHMSLAFNDSRAYELQQKTNYSDKSTSTLEGEVACLPATARQWCKWWDNIERSTNSSLSECITRVTYTVLSDLSPSTSVEETTLHCLIDLLSNIFINTGKPTPDNLSANGVMHIIKLPFSPLWSIIKMASLREDVCLSPPRLFYPLHNPLSHRTFIP